MKLQKQIINWLAVILWLGVIYFFSHQPDLKSELEPFYDLIFRKIAHMAEYFVLTYLLFRALSNYKLKFKNLLFISFFLSLVYAGFDEWHQSFVAGRHGSIIDTGIDSLGAIIFIGLILLYKKRGSD